MSTTPTIPVAELIRRLPSPNDIRRRLDEIAAERKALMTLLRAAIAADREFMDMTCCEKLPAPPAMQKEQT